MFEDAFFKKTKAVYHKNKTGIFSKETYKDIVQGIKHFRSFNIPMNTCGQ